MINPKALETFGKYDKKSLMAGITVGQGLKGRARAPQTRTDAPAGFPQDLWDAASQRANAMIARLQAEESGGTPSEPETPEGWTFDKDAFCFGLAAGRSLEGWEIDGAVSLGDGALIMYYVHLDNADTVYVHIGLAEGAACIDWGDESDIESFSGSGTSVWYYFANIECSHFYPSGDYVITIKTNCAVYPRGPRDGAYSVGVYAESEISSSHKILESAYFKGNIYCVDIGAFNKSVNLQYVTFADTARVSVMQGAFSGCTKLVGVIMPDKVRGGFGYESFKNCSNLRSITIPYYTTGIANETFYYCTRLTDVIIPYRVREIEFRAFEGCSSLSEITIPDSVTTIGSCAFRGCRFRHITIPDSVKQIGMYAFDENPRLQSISLPSGITIIPTGLVHGCSALRTIEIPDGVKTIESDAFYDCTSLKSVTIPNSVMTIQEGAFQSCPSLTDVYYSGTEEQWNDINIIVVDMYGRSNLCLTNQATIHYNSTGPDDVHDD